MIAVVEFFIIWVFIGVWIAWKREWYKVLAEDQVGAIILAVVLMPLILLLALIREFIFRDWDNNKH
jgi:ABC-type anion transport system duplicated permease subunit